METKPSRLTDHLGYWLRLVSNQVSGAFAEKLAGHDVSVVEWVLMRELHPGPLAPSALAEKLRMTRGAITKLADRLAARKLLRRQASAEDGRAQTLALTASGRALLPRLAALADANDAEFFSGLTAGERVELMRLLRKVAARKKLEGKIPVS